MLLACAFVASAENMWAGRLHSYARRDKEHCSWRCQVLKPQLVLGIYLLWWVEPCTNQILENVVIFFVRNYVAIAIDYQFKSAEKTETCSLPFSRKASRQATGDYWEYL